MATKRLERDVLRACLDYLKARNIFAWRVNTGAMRRGKRYVRFGFPGVSDIIGILPGGRFLAVECKSSTGKLSLDQDAFLTAVQLSGGVALWVRSAAELHDKLDAARNKEMLR